MVKYTIYNLNFFMRVRDFYEQLYMGLYFLLLLTEFFKFLILSSKLIKTREQNNFIDCYYKGNKNYQISHFDEI